MADFLRAQTVILIEDDFSIRLAMTQTLELADFRVAAYESAELALPAIQAGDVAMVITDVRLPGMSGLTLLAQLTRSDPDLPVILITGHGDVSMAVQAMRDGAYDFLEKPFAAERLLETCQRALEKRRLVLDNRRLRQTLALHPDTPQLIGDSAPMLKLKERIRHIGPVPVDVLIHGATGTGKEVVARHLHDASGRAGPFVAVNCGALPETVFESEMFGHEAGAFTGAGKRRIGKLEHASGGTLFLDEIESMPLALQVKLLRALQERQIERLGGNQLIPLDLRVVAATKTDLLALSQRQQFREDLYFRLAVVQLMLPALQDRRDDIPLLLQHFTAQAAQRFGLPVPVWSPQQMQQWQLREWPGNVRELKNFAHQLTLSMTQDDATSAQTEPDIADHSFSLPRKVEQFEADLIAAALKAHQGQVAAAAQALGVPRKTLYDKLRKYQLMAAES